MHRTVHRTVHRTDVAVVGYGPVGALAALLLGRAGLTVAVVDRRVEVHRLPRAVAADDEVLRLLVAAGLEAAVARMVVLPGATFLGRRGQPLVEVDFDGGGSGHPGLALFRQPDVEAALRARVADMPGVTPRLGRGVVGLAQDGAGVTLALEDGERLRAGFVLGCDGANSTVRDLVGVATRGPRAAQHWLVADVLTDDPRPTPDRVTYSCDPRHTMVTMPTPGGRRFEFLLPAGAPTPDVGPLLAPHLRGARWEVERVARYEYRVRRARRWRTGRVLLAGDAAHTMPPFAGQGLAAGFRDAADLAWRLPLVAGGRAASRLLDGYERERRPHVARMTALSRVAGAVLTTPSPAGAGARDLVLGAVTAVPGVSGWLRAGGPRPRQAYDGGSRLRPPRAGGSHGLLPDARVRARGAQVESRLDRHLAGRFTLLGVGREPVLSDADRAFWDPLGARPVVVVPPGQAVPPTAGGTLVLDDLDGALRLAPGAVVVVRPDGHVLAAADAARLPALTARVAHLLGGAATRQPAGSSRGDSQAR